jgi:Ser/Thr protein kinase RdoA (MazF antagonist)
MTNVPERARVVTVVLCLGDGRVLGSLAPFEVAVPWWQEVEPVVRGVRERHGIDVTVLRLLHGGTAGPPGGRVTYLASVESEPAVPLAPQPGEQLADDPLRLPYAKPGGPQADLDWADRVLRARGTPRVAPAVQVRTWNLSSLWRLPIADGWAWLKVVPPFFAHEGAMLSRLDGAVVAPLLAADGPRVLLDEVPGEDQYDAPRFRLRRMIGMLVRLQHEWAGRLSELSELGAPDWRASRLPTLACDVVARTAHALDAGTRAALAGLINGLPARFEQLAGCAIPDSLVHGDFHPGNVRGDGRRLVLLDWGDCGIGHPLLDQAAFMERVAPEDRGALQSQWSTAWRAALPASDPDRAAALIAPVAALRHAIIYRCFLDNIEASERIYHADDPAHWLTQAATLARQPA